MNESRGNRIISWLLEGPPWLERLVRLDLLEEEPENPGLEQLRRAGLAEPAIQEWLAELQSWPGEPIRSHKTLSLLIHKLEFLAGIGLRHDDEEISRVVDVILDSASAEGPFRVPILIPKAFRGSGQVENAWILTDAPVIVGALAAMGLESNPAVVKAAEYLAGMVKPNGWPCVAAPDLGKFRGPGRKEDSCPYATLLSLRMISRIPSVKDHPSVMPGISSLLNLWQDRQSRRPYMFGMGSDFLKLKAPYVWFDILHVVDVLSCFPSARETAEYHEMLRIILGKASPEGRFTAESVYRPASAFDFGDRKQPSRWITFQILRITEPESSR